MTADNRMKRQAVLLVALLGVGPLSVVDAADRPPNVIVIMIDDPACGSNQRTRNGIARQASAERRILQERRRFMSATRAS